MLHKLTTEQTAKLAEYRDLWIQRGLSTERADRNAAEDGVRKAYQAAGLNAPQFFIWLASPLSGSIGSAMLTQVGDQVVDQVRTRVGDQVVDQVRQVLTQVGDQVWDQVRQVGDQVVDQVRQVVDQVRTQIRTQVGGQVGDQVRTACYGQHDANWLGFYDFFRFTGIKACTALDGMSAVASSAGWWWPFQNMVILTDRPRVLRRDDLGRLHCEDGPALAWDDFSLWRWHGQRVPESVILHPESIALNSISSEPDAEVRRVMIERYGIGRYLHETGATLVDFDQVEVVRGSGRLMPRCLLRDSQGNAYLEGTDGSTDRTYFMPVDPKATTCREAHESINGGLSESCCVAQS